MPVLRRTLSRAEKSAHLARMRVLRARGVDVRPVRDQLPESQALEILLSPESKVCQTSTGGVCYAVRARILPRKSGLFLEDCQIATQLTHDIVLASFDEHMEIIDFGGIRYHRNEVLNSRFESYCRLTRGRPMEGWILAFGARSIPDQYRSGDKVDFELVLTDTLQQEFRTQGALSVWRSTKVAKQAPRKASSIYDGGVPEPSLSEEMRARYLAVRRQSPATVNPPSQTRG